MKHARGDDPLVQLLSANAERFFEALIGTGAVAVEGNGKGVDAEFGHGAALSSNS
jgi:hypothetical protein